MIEDHFNARMTFSYMFNQMMEAPQVFQTLLLIFFAFLSLFSGTYITYFVYINKYVKKPWKLQMDRSFQPKISILIPVHNEEDVIESKLRNIKTVSYPPEKIELILADDASDDGTLVRVENFLNAHPNFDVKIVKQRPHEGKSAALNNKTFVIST